MTSMGSADGGGAQGGGAQGGASAQGGGAPAASTGAAPTTSSTGMTDPFEAAREACIAKINALRATKSRAPYSRWMAVESCVDQEATQDEMTMMPHGAWLSGAYSCNGNGQNECLGQGPSGITECLDQMWAEKDYAECSGCDACAGAYNPSCANCDFYGNNPAMHECGHYVNLSAEYFTMAACGFSSLMGWDAINFE
jgi:hypothetical protein